MYLLFIGGAIVIVLAGVAAYLHIKLYRRRQAQAQQVTDFLDQRRVELNRSIQVLAEGLINEQLTSTEAAIRISHLLEQLNVSTAIKEEFAVFFQLAKVTKHIPILEAYKALSKRQQARYDAERHKWESSYGDFILDAAKRIQHRTF